MTLGFVIDFFREALHSHCQALVQPDYDFVVGRKVFLTSSMK